MADASATDKDMITVITEECNEISQEFYDNTMVSIQACQFKCSCGHYLHSIYFPTIIYYIKYYSISHCLKSHKLLHIFNSKTRIFCNLIN